MKLHEKYIKRCLELAELGLGRTYPNPMVGSVVVYKNRIIGEGWHRKAGEAHAEVNAINSVEDKKLLPKATIYVSLEPCSHFGKTPPCSDLIIACGIRRVVIGTMDPFAKVAGRGIQKLMAAGCRVTLGVLEKDCQEINKRFFTFHQKKRPYIILKWAESAEGYISPPMQEGQERKPVWITNKYSRQLVHKWRSEEQGILIGTNTAVADNPSLNTRLWDGDSPVRVVIDRRLRVPQESNLFDGSIRTIVLTEMAPEQEVDGIAFEEIDFRMELAPQICQVLYKNEIQSFIIEGGRKTLQTFIEAGLWDEARVFTGAVEFNNGVNAPELKAEPVMTTQLQSDVLKYYRND